MLNLKNVKLKPQEGQYSGGFEDFGDRIKTQEEIAEMVEVCFGKNAKLNLEEFQKISEDKSSDMLLVVLNILREKLPCSENFYNFQDEFARQMAAEGKVPEQKTKKLASPMMRSLSPTAGTRGSPRDSVSTGSSVLSKLAGGEESKINIDKFKSRAEERK